jgi:aspartyl-tRNA(Asn)/glutamyl-tRNA(Gln) amidotransferase subunit A
VVRPAVAMSATWDLTIDEASELIAKRDCSAAELLEAVLERLTETEPIVRAWASVDEVGARSAAAAADRRLASGQRCGRMHGIPVGLKDVIDTEGWPTEAGSRVLAGHVPAADAVVVAQLRRAGAVILGKTVTYEFAYGQDHPPTRNPWDQSRYPGGSSVGSGVAVAVGSALATLGTDTGGSIRNPAAINGLVGLKPTNGLVSRRGVIPVSPSLDQVGPLTKTVADCAIVLQEIAGRDHADRTTVPIRLPDYRSALERPLASLRIGVDRQAWQQCGVEPCAKEAVDAALVTLERCGAEVVEISMPSLDLALATGLTLFLSEATAWHQELLATRIRDYSPGTRVMLALGALVPGSDYVRAQHVREVVRDEVRTTFERHRLDAIASPTLPGPAVPAAELRTDLTRTGETNDLAGALRLLNWANVCGLPAISVPCGASPEGLPLGLQLTGRPFKEATLLCAASMFEWSTDWHRRRPAIGHGIEERSI